MEGKLALNPKITSSWGSVNPTHLVNPYTWGVAAVGLAILLAALFELPGDLFGLLLFAALAGVAELGSIELYLGSRGRVSVSSVIAIASVLTFGPLAGALTYLASGLMTLVTTTLFQQEPEQAPGRAAPLQRIAFNTGMLVAAAYLAGRMYVFLGGIPGDVQRLQNLPALIGAATTDTLANLALLVIVISLQTRQRPLKIWKENFLWAMPIPILGNLLGGGGLALTYYHYGPLGLAVLALPVLATSYAFRVYMYKSKADRESLKQLNLQLQQANASLEAANQTLEQNNRELIETLSAVVDAEDAYTFGHSKQVTIYAQKIGERLGLSLLELNRLEIAALLHDMGKVGVSENLYSRQGLLTAEDYNVIKRHPAIGAQIVGRMTGLQDIAQIIKHHHERWDGRGYPEGLAGEDIPLLARILAVADAVDVMCSDRPYRPTMSFREMQAEVARCAGSQFDPAIAQALLDIAQEYGSGLFPNSAALVDQRINNHRPSVRFMKKSEINS